MNHYGALKKIMPIDLGADSDKDMAAEGELLDSAAETIMHLLPEFYPSTTTEMLIDRWEREYGLIPNAEATLTARRGALAAKVVNTYGLSRQYFIDLAATLGYTIDIIEAAAPFRAGISAAGDVVYEITEMWIWEVHVLNAAAASNLEVLFAELNPPHMRLNFVY